ncbi:MAG: hypothetical protein CL677_09450 [Bdellovibrionaceae bacterium]|nr:hypothetical protein [Pseudobdellovibrionaceae bacterium]|tara:strand:- start:24305 stop:24826 length:522 start_codon:yes stop_codon:yes gene_type:complete
MSSLLKALNENFGIEEFLMGVELFKDVPEKEQFITALSHVVEVKDFNKNETIFEEGDGGENLYILREGEVVVQKSNPDGQVFNVIVLSSKEKPAIGEGGLIERSPRSATVRCRTQCSFVVLSRDKFNHFCEEHPKWGIAVYRSIFKIMVLRLRKMNTDLMLLHKALTNEIRGN